MKALSQHHSRARRSRRRGFTLMEMMIATAVTVLAMGMGTGLFIELMRSFWTSEKKNIINGEVRSMTAQMITEAREANEIFVYESFAHDHRNQSSDRHGSTESGDLMILVFYNSPEEYAQESLVSPGTAKRRIERIVGYYRLPINQSTGLPDNSLYYNTSFEGPLVRFESWIPASQQTEELETLINNYCQDEDEDPNGVPHKAIIGEKEQNRSRYNYLEGLAKGRLFYLYTENSIMVNGKINHGSDAKQVTNTYNFTISPRG